MDNPEIKPSLQPQLSELQAQCDALRQLVLSLLVVLLLVSGTLTIFLARQWRFTKSQIELMSPQANQILTEFNKNLPMMQDFIRKLNDYGKTHADFAPIVAKYHLTEALGKPGTTPATNAAAKK
jgi:hypothetical protein